MVNNTCKKLRKSLQSCNILGKLCCNHSCNHIHVANDYGYIKHWTLGHAKSICTFLGPRAWKLSAIQISRDLKLKALKEKKRIHFLWVLVMNIIMTKIN